MYSAVGCHTRAARWTAAGSGLRVCADPDNLPYSDSRQQGLENRLAQFVGPLGRAVPYVWVSQRGKYFKALTTDVCDAVMEAPTGLNGIETTRTYYRSSYVFLSRRGNQSRHSFLRRSAAEGAAHWRAGAG